MRKNLKLRLLLQSIFFSVFLIYSLHNYFVGVYREDKIFSKRYLNKTIDISQQGTEYDFRISHILPYNNHQIFIDIPALSILDYSKQEEIANNLTFKLGVVLENNGQKICDAVYNTSGTTRYFSKSYSYKKGQSNIFNLKIKVIEPEDNERFSIASITARAFSKMTPADTTRWYRFPAWIFLGLLLVTVLEFCLRMFSNKW
ncbi:MAG: hypothetical protein JW734_05435 [Candidatus Omnitrophica bacterium]|nr:hypothetical protein [Candidatus Omnitrophota bacterium]